MNDFTYFAAHAPDIPDWFLLRKWKEEVTTTDPKTGFVSKQTVFKIESRMEHLVRWRMEYATAMVQSLEQLQKNNA